MNVNAVNPIAPPAPLTDRRLAELYEYGERAADGTCGRDPAMILRLAELRAITRELVERRSVVAAVAARAADEG